MTFLLFSPGLRPWDVWDFLIIVIIIIIMMMMMMMMMNGIIGVIWPVGPGECLHSFIHGRY